MKLTISPYAAEHVESVRALNKRLAAGGSAFKFPVNYVPTWLPPGPGIPVFQEQFVVTDEEGVVRGGFILKHQDFQVGARTVRVTDLQLPLSEGSVDSKYASVGVFIMKHASKQSEFLYGLGMGGLETPVAKTFKSLLWHLELVPFLFRVNHAGAFLRNLRALRHSASRRAAMDLLALSGLGALGLAALKLVRPGARVSPDVRWERLDVFGDWADDVWERARGAYGLAAVRDRANLDALYPDEDRKFIRIRVLLGRDTIGWAVLLCSPLRDHRQFGQMRVGTIVDCLSLPGLESEVAAVATRVLEELEADLLVSNQASPIWIRALKECAYREGPSNFALALSRKLHQELGAKAVAEIGCHMNRGDGDGPINLY